MQSRANQVIPNQFEREDQPKNDEAVLWGNDSTVVSCPDLGDQVEDEVADDETENGADDGCGVNCGEITEVKVICGDDEDGDGGVVADRPWDCAQASAETS